MVARNTCQHRTCAEIKRKIELAGSNEITQSLFAALTVSAFSAFIVGINTPSREQGWF